MAWLGAAVAAASAVPAALPAGTATAATDNDTIVQLFEWPWASVASECTNVLGPKGYGAVQVSPPASSASLPDKGHPWWEVYQPNSYALNSRMGNREEFQNMVATCHAAGVKVYADAVLNHMTGQDGGGTGYDGTSFPDKYDYPNLYTKDDFHQPPCTVNNYTDAHNVQFCELEGLADLKTESDGVRTKLAGYLNDLESLGVDGFRLDAAKHIPVDDIAAIEGKLGKPAFIYQEVSAGGSGDAVQPNQYEPTGSLLEFRFGRGLKSAFQGSIAGLSDFGSGMEPSDKAVSFVDNHDTQRDGSTLSYKDGQQYVLANIFALGWNYGTPKVMSSYTFNGHDDSPPAGSDGKVSPVKCGSGWECEHQKRPIANMVGFHNAVRGTDVANWWSNGNNQIAFSRGAKGFVAINNEGGTLAQTLQTGLPAGTYCDVIHGDLGNGGCTGPTVTVGPDGKAQLSVNASDAVAIHAGAKVS
ncbi:alpha-amylase [Saccharopolyspora rosea]|uniref:Alpha-amylase n=1 Tax=Saccharopolyspora rosea TaxID=524884 RepID=A0ABW3FUM8_9PSEU|nr:alpha-amylase family protein [Saccharopolyspora rosea]